MDITQLPSSTLKVLLFDVKRQISILQIDADKIEKQIPVAEIAEMETAKTNNIESNVVAPVESVATPVVEEVVS